jgi:hypothetical protein
MNLDKKEIRIAGISAIVIMLTTMICLLFSIFENDEYLDILDSMRFFWYSTLLIFVFLFFLEDEGG